MISELEFIRYLSSNQYPALRTVLSNNSEELVTASTPWGEYYASVFERVLGNQIGSTDLSDAIMIEYGKTLGKLHKLSSQYNPKNRRWSYEDVFQWIKKTLRSFNSQEFALAEVDFLQMHFSKIPKSPENYGLVHYDFELDNVFYDEAIGTCHVIDFDDAMYHWYAMDIEQAFESINDELEPLCQEQAKKCFLKGYESVYSVTDQMLSLLPLFKRFANLYGYTRILRSSAEIWSNEPEWLIGLRAKLDEMMKNKSMNFGDGSLI